MNKLTDKKIEYVALDRRVLAVAVEGEMKDWAAYIGAVPGENHEEEFGYVARRGTKLPEAISKILFPSFVKLHWRD